MAHKSNTTHASKATEQLSKPSKATIATQIITSLVFIALIVVFSFGDFQYNLFNSGVKVSSVNCWVLSDNEKAYFTQQETDLKDQSKSEEIINEGRNKASADENKINFKDRTVELKTNLGDIAIKTLDKVSPIAAENFIRLSSRGKFDGLTFYKIADQDKMRMIYSGDPKNDGTGGESAFGAEFKDEMTLIQPLPTSCKTDIAKLSTPTFVDNNLYSNYENGSITYKKGIVAMDNSGKNSNTSRFFIVLEDSVLPPSYTIFGKVEESSFSVLDKIKTEAKPSPESTDGKPSKEIKIEKAILK